MEYLLLLLIPIAILKQFILQDLMSWFLKHAFNYKNIQKQPTHRHAFHRYFLHRRQYVPVNASLHYCMIRLETFVARQPDLLLMVEVGSACCAPPPVFNRTKVHFARVSWVLKVWEIEILVNWLKIQWHRPFCETLV